MLVASVTTVIAAARRATNTIPIVMANAADPVASGFVAGLARLGGNVTGVSRLVPELVGKHLELLVAVVPRLAREALALGVELDPAEASAVDRFETALEGFSRKRVGAVLVLGDVIFFLNRARLASLLVQARLPSMFANTEHVEAGGLMSCSAGSGHRMTVVLELESR